MITYKNKNKSFTLIELLVVIAVIGLISSIVLVSMKGTREKARMTKAQEDLKQIETAIIVTRDEEDKVLGQITGHWCSDCACRNVGDLSTLPDSHQCIINLRTAFNKIGLPLLKDPWGSPYLIDENENECAWSEAYAHCRNDSINSAGPDRTYIATDIIIDSKIGASYDNDGPGRLVPLHACPPYVPICP